MDAEKAFENEVRDCWGSSAINVDCAVGEKLCCYGGCRFGCQSGCNSGAAGGGANSVCV